MITAFCRIKPSRSHGVPFHKKQQSQPQPQPRGLGDSSAGSGLSSKLWHELGGGIDKAMQSDLTGYSVASSKSGSIIAVGSPIFVGDFLSKAPGRVRVYRYDDQQNTWSQIGRDIEGDRIMGGITGDQFGKSIALSDDGRVLAVGAPKCNREGKKEVGCVQVYELTVEAAPSGVNEGGSREVWINLGDTIVGEKDFDHFGAAIHISDSYNVIADRQSYKVCIGAPDVNGGVQLEESGAVYIYRLTWREDVAVFNWDLTATIVDANPEPFAKFGASLAMAIDAKTLVVGAPQYGERQGIIRLFRQNDNGKHIQLTLPSYLDQNEEGETCGSSVSIDKSGYYVAYGCPQASHGWALESGKVKILKMKISMDGTVTWSRRQIFAESGEILFGSSLMLSEIMDGHIFIAIGAPKSARLDESKSLIQDTGHVQVYYNTDNDEWEQAGLDVEGLEQGDEFGSSVAISGDGHIVIGGAPLGAGYAKIYKLDYTAPPTPAPSIHDHGLSQSLLNKKKQRSVWIVFLISAGSFLALAAIFALMRTERRNFQGLNSSNEHGIELHDSGLHVSNVEMKPSVGSSGEMHHVI